MVFSTKKDKRQRSLISAGAQCVPNRIHKRLDDFLVGLEMQGSHHARKAKERVDIGRASRTDAAGA